MKKVSLLFVASAIAVGSAYACGGGEEPAKNPNDVGSASATVSASATPSATTSASATTTASASASAVATTPPAPEAPPLAIEGIKITGKSKDGKAVAVEVKPDGSIVGTKDGKTMTLGTFVKNELKDDKGLTILAAAADGKVTAGPTSGPPGSFNMALGAFNDKDELVGEGKTLLSIGADGVVSLTNKDGKSEKAPFKFEKLPAKSKRAAVFLTMLLFMPAPTAAPPPAVSSGPVKPAPSSSAAPKK